MQYELYIYVQYIFIIICSVAQKIYRNTMLCVSEDLQNSFCNKIPSNGCLDNPIVPNNSIVTLRRFWHPVINQVQSMSAYSGLALMIMVYWATVALLPIMLTRKPFWLTAGWSIGPPHGPEQRKKTDNKLQWKLTFNY